MVAETSNNLKEYIAVKQFVNSFFEYYYNERDVFKVNSIMSDNIMAIGLNAKEEAMNREDFLEYVHHQMDDIPYPVVYHVSKYTQKEISENVWAVVAKVVIKLHTIEWLKVNYNLRISLTLHKENDSYLIDAIHVSEPIGINNNHNKLFNEDVDETSFNNSLVNIISQLLPGGLICSYLDNDYEIKLANDHILNLLEYDDFDSYYLNNKGKYLNNIHHDDINKYLYNVNFAMTTSKQCECEYRLSKKDGTYIWVHDVLRVIKGEDGRDMIFSALVDISDQVKRQEMLKFQSEIDDLTGVYNRKGTIKSINDKMIDSSKWAFFMSDLDNFKSVNDLYGHKTGDDVLCYVANQFRTYFFNTATVGRLGGDEFIVFVTDFDDLQEVEYKLNTVATRLKEYAKECAKDADCSLSIGGVYGCGLEDFNDIYNIADNNLYKIKKSQKGQIIISSI